MVEKLFDAITSKNSKLLEMVELFGEDHWYVRKMLDELFGMREAFQIIAGHSYTDHLIGGLSMK